MSTITLPTNNHFSFTRVWMCARYYSPQLRLQLWLWPAVCAAMLALATALMYIDLIGLALTVASWTGFLITLAPLMLLRSRAAEVDTMLPVKVSERVTFLLLYFIIALPALVNLTALLMVWISKLFLDSTQVDLLFRGIGVWETLPDLSGTVLAKTIAMSIGTSWMSLMGCLLGVVAFKNHRAIKAIGLSIGTPFLLGLITGIASVFVIIDEVSVNGTENIDSMAEAAQQSSGLMTQLMTMSPMATIMTVMIFSAWIITFAELFWMVYRLKRRQL